DPPAVLGNPYGLIMTDALATTQPRDDLNLFVMQFGRDEAHDRLADHLARPVAEDVGRTGIPRGDPAIEGLADDRVVRGRDNGGELRGQGFRLVARGEVHQQIDGPGDAAALIAHRRGKREETHPAAVGTFGDGLDPADRPSLPERHRRGAFIMAQRLPVQAKKPIGPAPSGGPDLWPAAPEFRG